MFTRPTSISVVRHSQPSGNRPIAPHDIGLKARISSGSVSTPPAPTTAAPLYRARSSPIPGWHCDRVALRSVRRPSRRAIPLPTLTSGSLTGYPYTTTRRLTATHMASEISNSGQRAIRGCPRIRHFPASTHPPIPCSQSSTSTRRRPPIVFRLRTVANADCQCARGLAKACSRIAKTFQPPSQHWPSACGRLLDHIASANIAFICGAMSNGTS